MTGQSDEEDQSLQREIIGFVSRHGSRVEKQRVVEVLTTDGVSRTKVEQSVENLIDSGKIQHRANGLIELTYQ